MTRFVLTGVLLLAFVAVQIRQNEKATLPPRIVQNRNIWSSAWFAITLNSILDDTRRKCGFFILADLNGHEGEQENTSEHEKNLVCHYT
jgi:hypothetical protein